MKKALSLLTLFLSLTAQDFLSSPQILSEVEIDQGIKTRELEMTCQLPDGGYLHFSALDDRVAFKIGRPSSCTITSPRLVKKAAPKALSITQLFHVIQHTNVLFYTGAGLSAASNVPMMKELEKLLGLDQDREQIIAEPNQLIEGIRQFYYACCSNPPTEAHCALAEIALWKDAQIVTENLDHLHERTAIMPYRIAVDQIRNESSDIDQVDYIICIGLSHDDKGFLGWYKEKHPKGKIISIDLEQPNYLGNEDFFLRGDLQKIIPQIFHMIRKLDKSSAIS